VVSEEKRHSKRIKPPFVIRFRRIDDSLNEGKWDSAIPHNISETGIYFNSTEKFEEGAILQVKMKDYRIHEENSYRCTVVRSELASKTGMFYGTAVKITGMSEEAKEGLHRAIEYLNDMKK
jgi:hypothetical protein